MEFTYKINPSSSMFNKDRRMCICLFYCWSTNVTKQEIIVDFVKLKCKYTVGRFIGTKYLKLFYILSLAPLLAKSDLSVHTHISYIVIDQIGNWDKNHLHMCPSTLQW